MKKIKDNISIIIIIGIIILSTFIIGKPTSRFYLPMLYIIISLFSIFYYIIKREKLIKDRIDVWVVILSFTSFIPLIFKTYVSLSETIYEITKYICILNIFLIAKNECKKNPKYIHIILNTIIISILLLSIIGLDELGGNCFKQLRLLVRNNPVKGDETKITSLFSYSNAMAIIAAAGIFLSVGYIFYCKSKKIKLIYLLASVIMFIAMILTYSRLAYIVFVIMSILYILILCKKYNIKQKINKKTILGISFTIFLLVIYVIIGLQIPDKLNVKEKYRKVITDFQVDTDYVFSFDINAESDIENNFLIEIAQKNNYSDNVDLVSFEFDSFKGNKEIKIHTKKETEKIHVYIYQKELPGTCIINKMTLNDEEIILKYKLLPTDLVSKIQAINLKQKSVMDRFIYIKDAFKQISDNWILGCGGNAWRTLQFKDQEYNYYAKEVHSFPTQILLENGIVAIIAYLGIVICIVKSIYREIKKEDIDILKIGIIISILTILLHSTLDFGMSYFYSLLILFLMIASFSNDKEIKDVKIVYKVIKIILIILSIIILYISIIESYFEEHKNAVKVSLTCPETMVYQRYYNLIPHNYEIKTRRYWALKKEKNYEKMEEVLNNIIETEKYEVENLTLVYMCSYVESIIDIDDDIEQQLDKIFNYICDTEMFGKYNVNIQFSRLNNLNIMVEKLSNCGKIEYTEKFKQQLINEINKKERYILDYERCGYPKNDIEKIRETLYSYVTNIF